MESASRPCLAMVDRRQKSGSSGRPRRNGEPGWAKGLRKLYNSVVDEPLPDNFEDLLKKLDASDNGK